MAEQTFLIKIKKQFHPSIITKLAARIHQCKGRILLLSDGGYTMIASLDYAFKEVIQRRHEVALIGGVEIKHRSIPRIRVDGAGRPLSSDSKPISTRTGKSPLT